MDTREVGSVAYYSMGVSIAWRGVCMISVCTIAGESTHQRFGLCEVLMPLLRFDNLNRTNLQEPFSILVTCRLSRVVNVQSSMSTYNPAKSHSLSQFQTVEPSSSQHPDEMLRCQPETEHGCHMHMAPYPFSAGKLLPKFENSLQYDSVPTSPVGATEVACRRERDDLIRPGNEWRKMVTDVACDLVTSEAPAVVDAYKQHRSCGYAQGVDAKIRRLCYSYSLHRYLSCHLRRVTRVEQYGQRLRSNAAFPPHGVCVSSRELPVNSSPPPRADLT